MAKKKSLSYVCNACNTRFPKWIGRCTQCNAWNQVLEDESQYGDNVISMHNWLLRKAYQVSQNDSPDLLEEEDTEELHTPEEDPATPRS